MSYTRFCLMITVSTLVMFVLMYLNTYAWEHVFFSETRVYMALMMGATMALVMLAFMLGMYSNVKLNVIIVSGAILAFVISLWLVRSQTTVSGLSYLRAMIPHHSIAVMTSERAGIEDARVRKLADSIIAAQRKEIAEMRYLIADIAEGHIVTRIAQSPPPQPGSLDDALGRVRIPLLDLAPLTREQSIAAIPGGGVCRFNRSPESDPVLWTSADGSVGVILLNNTLISLAGRQGELSAEGVTVAVRSLGDQADWRSDAELVFGIEPNFEVGYRGFWRCQ